MGQRDRSARWCHSIGSGILVFWRRHRWKKRTALNIGCCCGMSTRLTKTLKKCEKDIAAKQLRQHVAVCEKCKAHWSEVGPL